MLRRTLPGPLSSVPAHRTPHAATAEMWGGQARCTWLRQGRDGLRRSPRVRGRSGRRALARRACRGWRDLRHEKRAEDGGVWSEGPGDRTRPRRGGKGSSSAGQDSGAPDTRRGSAPRAGCHEGDLASLKTWPHVHAPAARKHCRSLYSDGREDYTPGLRSMSGRHA